MLYKVVGERCIVEMVMRRCVARPAGGCRRVTCRNIRHDLNIFIICIKMNFMVNVLGAFLL